MKTSGFKSITKVLELIAVYYLSAKMVCFAIPKILFMQFRILHWQSHVPLVEVSDYLHMWSFFGRSYNYNLFIGIVEFLIGSLILFKRTRLIALLLALGLCVNILILNIEFDIYFALPHLSLDLVLITVLLLGYGKDLYEFFIKQGGRFDKYIVGTNSKIGKLFPFLFVTTLSVSYFAFSVYVKSKYAVNEDIVGSHEITQVKINDSVANLSKGSIGKFPMMFLEYNNQFVLSLEDSLYMGRYILDNQNIRIYFDRNTPFKTKSILGSLQGNSIQGKIDANRTIDIVFERIDGSQNYLNELYR